MRDPDDIYPPDRSITRGHRALARTLGFMRVQVEMLAEPGDYAVLSRLLNGVNYMRWYGGVAHHSAEDILFERLLKKDASAGELCKALADQHMAFEAREREIMLDICHACDCDAAAVAALRDKIADYCYMHVEHIQTEESELLPRARKLLSAADWISVQVGFEAAAARVPGPDGSLLGELLRAPHTATLH